MNGIQWSTSLDAKASGYPIILTPTQASSLLQISRSCLYSHVSQGRYKRAVKRGKPLRFHRDLLVREFFRQA